jgi:hypothetical protein
MAVTENFDRRRFLTTGVASAALSLSVPRLSLAQPARTTEYITPEAEAAIAAGLKFLEARQRPDGSIGSGHYRANVAVAGLTGLAFMSHGSTPNRGPYGQAVERCVDFLLNNTQGDGFIVVDDSSSHGPMYGHGFATLFLAECYGMTGRADIREKLSKAVSLIVDAQNDEGGWRYRPIPEQADLSVTICEVMALRAARNAGIYVPRETIERAIGYVKECQNPDGGFRYLSEPGSSRFPLTAAGVVALYMAGVYEGKEIENGLQYLMSYLPQGHGPVQQSHYFYGHYYAVQAMWHAGGQLWDAWYPAIRDELVMHQRPQGSWFSTICPEYGTAMACIILQLPNNFLPIIQR